jgi:hypothetical protein
MSMLRMRVRHQQYLYFELELFSELLIAVFGGAAGHRRLRRRQLPRFPDGGEQGRPFERWHGSAIMHGCRPGIVESKPFGRGSAGSGHGLRGGAGPSLPCGGVTLRPVPEMIARQSWQQISAPLLTEA